MSSPGTGFSRNFLSIQFNLPELMLTNKQNAFIVDGSEIINYTHFSLALNKFRRFAFWVAWNIDGGNIKRISRKGVQFSFDPAIPREFQVVKKYMEVIGWIVVTSPAALTCFGEYLQKHKGPIKTLSFLPISRPR